MREAGSQDHEVYIFDNRFKAAITFMMAQFNTRNVKGKHSQPAKILMFSRSMQNSISPYPVVITAIFVGFLLKGFWGTLAATIGIFTPPYLDEKTFQILSSCLRVN